MEEKPNQFLQTILPDKIEKIEVNLYNEKQFIKIYYKDDSIETYSSVLYYDQNGIVSQLVMDGIYPE